MKKRILFLMMISLSSFLVSAQSAITLNSQIDVDFTDFVLERSIVLNENSKTEEVLVEVQEKTISMKLEIRGRVKAGKLSIQIFNADGDKEGEFSVGNQTKTSEREEANGRITKAVLEPKPGNWKIKIVPEKVDGIVDIRVGSTL